MCRIIVSLRIHLPLMLLLACGMLLTPNTFAADIRVGDVVAVRGQAQIRRTDGALVSPAKGDVLYRGDTLVTGPRGWIRVNVAAKGLLTVGVNSEISVATLGAEKDGSSGIALGFLKGVMRWVTSKVRRTTADVRITAPMGTIGIRGTDFRLWLCTSGCGTQDGGDTGAGMFISVYEGRIEFTNDTGTVEYDLGSHAFVRDRATPPSTLTSPPQMPAELAQALLTRNVGLQELIQEVVEYGLSIEDVVAALVTLEIDRAPEIVRAALALAPTYAGDDPDAYRQAIIDAAIAAGADPATLLEAPAAGPAGGGGAPAGLGGIGGGAVGGGGGAASPS